MTQLKKKVNLAKPEAKVTTPSTAAINALRKMNIKNISIFTPYSKALNLSLIHISEPTRLLSI